MSAVLVNALIGFQIEVARWNDHNFPGKKPHQPLLGIQGPA